MARADSVVAVPNAAHTSGGATNYVVETPSGVLYLVIINVNVDVAFMKSTDRGITWSDQTTVFTGTTQALSIWYDRWSGISAGKIHCVYTESVNSDVLYRSIDTESSDALSTETTVFNGASAAGSGCLTIARMRGGNLLVYAIIDAGVEGGLFRSTDVGANWTGRSTSEAFATQDQWIITPGWAADNQDAILFFWDASGNEIFRYLYDDSADTWSKTSIAASMADVTASTSAPHYSVAVDITNSQNVLVAWSGVDTANADLRCWTITESSITEVTNVVLNSTDDQGLAVIGINTGTGHWYVAYGGKSDGSETWSSAVKFYYKVSTDSGSTWGAETILTSITRNTRWMATAPRFQLPFGVAYYSTATSTFLYYNSDVRVPRATCAVGF